jgi:hypothetical protein
MAVPVSIHAAGCPAARHQPRRSGTSRRCLTDPSRFSAFQAKTSEMTCQLRNARIALCALRLLELCVVFSIGLWSRDRRRAATCSRT